MHDHSLGFLVQTEEAGKSRVLLGLKQIVHGRLAVVFAVSDVLEEKLDLLAGDDVADIVGLSELAEDKPDHLAVNQGGAAAVSRVDGGVNLDA